ncbi:glucosamine-6-phosphate deaminase [Limimaricola pyoseonensis]|uniref:Glucosamine-6-phosphate deaminase n=1 Tax=Limimaricola pyoseonensis TaxID=521013 RepID=A0A1G7HKT0_9RHOB|nr:glucosamine-6-phosphate deaminase [Limimaricola pyoseonensis]SDF00874.1 glucosamine-6-phosphate deaminase [Limimaricola pyoseonensis]
MSGPRVEILDSATDVAERAAARIAAACAAPSPVLGLATGRTPLAVYAALRERIAPGGLRLDHATFFNLDEYAGLPPGHPASFASYMRRELFDPASVPEGRWHLPDGNGGPAEADGYEAAIAAAGGIGLQLLGIGRNGHVGFNEPGAAHDSRTRRVRLTEQTRQANAPDFPAGTPVPEHAVTMGIGTILEAREILLLATGAAKAEALAAALEGPVTEAVPASALQRHPRVTVLCDVAAGRNLRRMAA